MEKGPLLHRQDVLVSASPLGPLIRKTAVASFTRTLGTMLQSGVSIIDALEICSESSGNDIVAEAIENTRAQIAEGKAMVEPLLDSGGPAMVCSMIAVGEQSGALDVMLTKSPTFMTMKWTQRLMV